MNSLGVKKMIRNVFAVQQSLTNIIAFRETHFDRVRRYYSLLNYSEEVNNNTNNQQP
jgi:hypothetical protein